MLIDSIIPMQNSLRDLEQIAEMVDFVRGGGIFSRRALDLFAQEKGMRSSPLIKIARFEDQATYLHDGHHRMTSIWLGGRRELDSQEYVIEDWKYQDYLEINLDQTWYTIYDPRKEVRKSNIKGFKNKVEVFRNGEPKPTLDQIRSFILVRYEAQEYTEPRSVTHISEVASRHTLAIS